MEQTPLHRYQEQAGEFWVVPKEVEGGGLKIKLRSTRELGAPPPNLTTRKRKSLEKSPISGYKRVKMDEKDMKRIVAESLEQATDTFRSALLPDIRKIIEESTQPISAQLTELEKASTRVAENCDANTEKIKKLGEQMDGLKESLKDDLRKELREDLAKGQNAAFKIGLAKEIERVSSNLIIHGLTPNTLENVKATIEKMGIPPTSTIEVKRVVSLGKGEKAKSTLVTLGDQYQRNTILGHAAPENLPDKVKMDRDIPPSYREEYKIMQTECWKWKSFYKVTCKIAFVGHEMVMRYKDKDRAFTIVRTFTPSQSKVAKETRENRTQGGIAPSCSVTADKKLEATKSFFMPEIKNMPIKEIEEKLMEELGEDYFKVIEVSLSGGRPLVLCDSRESCLAIAKLFKDRGATKIVVF